MNWKKLVAAAAYYASTENDVFVFLPRFHGEFAAEMAELRSWCGQDCIVTCPSGHTDDHFMIQFAQDKLRIGYDAYIVTNDLFRDHKASHGVTEHWVEARTIKFAFAAGFFVPESIVK